MLFRILIWIAPLLLVVCLFACIYLDFLGFRGSSGFLRALLPLLGFAAFDSVNGEGDAGGCVLSGCVWHCGSRDLLITTFCSTALSYYQDTNNQIKTHTGHTIQWAQVAKSGHYNASIWTLNVFCHSLPDTLSGFRRCPSSPFLLSRPLYTSH